jgi:tetratricopeptide (TPR) repeat protein
MEKKSMKRIFLVSFIILISVYGVYADNSVTVIRVTGPVHVRYGIEETWHPVTAGLLLRDIDTIMTGEGSEVILQLQDGRRFTLGRNSILDIADLKIVLQKELFLYLTTQKVMRLEPPDSTKPVRIGNVSIVHGGKRDADSIQSDSVTINTWIAEFNGAIALYMQKYFPNAVIKLHKILEKYHLGDNRVQIYFYIGKSLEALNLSGQAINAYQFVVDHFEQNKPQGEDAERRASEARMAIQRLRSKS